MFNVPQSVASASPEESPSPEASSVDETEPLQPANVVATAKSSVGTKSVDLATFI